ncbi:hypothetical protein GLW00_13110 [Halobacillus litoralis]|uniref:Uncharacterized protein n=1 Tax=Halobacillus litoralis TaxID=45668 RepID=A0A845FD72_9BACI|nr:hypothetical protein [Halobacillus litoralis]MYL71799.1 hypothetical protein [Halobacillus litoralis]
MVTVLKIIGIPLYIYGVSLLVYPLFDMDVDGLGQIVLVIPVTLIAYWQVFFARNNEK